MKNNKKLTAVILAIILGCGISLAGCGKNETQTETGTPTTTPSQEYSQSVSNSTEPTMLNQEPSSSVSSDEPSTQAPVLKETVLKGTNSSVLTIHTNGTYDFVCSDYYLSTKDYPALKALLIMANDEQKKYIVEKDGAKALGPISLSFNADTYSVSGGTLTLGNKKPVYVDKVGWEIPAISTVTKSGNSYKISIKGDNGKYKFDFAEFTLTAEQAKNIGL
jgi:plastocyanin